MHDDLDGIDSLTLLVRVDWVTASIISLTFYHYIITLHEEFRFVWQQRFSGATIIYLANRYLVLCAAVLTCIITFLHTDSDKFCKAVTSLAAALLQAAQLTQGVFATLRLYAIREHSNVPAIIVLTLYSAAFVIRMVWIVLAQVESYPSYMGCIVIHDNQYLRMALTSRLLLMTADLLVVICTWIKTASIRSYVQRCDIRLPGSTLLFRDGTVCFS
ncbi:hypothetical protein BDW22DRAFT_1352790 [Trametopsis cervina]|nr:hypothetical protein BDW22DRAFT_1352790 [Trametopsis cervina]